MKIRKGEGYIVVINGFQGIGWITRYMRWHDRADFETCMATVCDYRGAISILASAKRAGIIIGKRMPKGWEERNCPYGI